MALSSAQQECIARRPKRKTTHSLWFNGFLLGLSLATLISPAISIRLHIWLGILTFFAVVGHLLLHRQWLQAVIRRFGQPLTPLVRARVILNIVMLGVFLLLNLTGGVSALIYAPEIGELHRVLAPLFVLLVGGHLALNRKWIVQNMRNLVGHRASQHDSPSA